MTSASKKKDLQVVGAPAPRKPVEKLPSRVQPTMSYDAWWLTTQRRLQLQSGLKDALRKHMKARGFLASGRFDDGLKDFGIGS